MARSRNDPTRYGSLFSRQYPGVTDAVNETQQRSDPASLFYGGMQRRNGMATDVPMAAHAQPRQPSATERYAQDTGFGQGANGGYAPMAFNSPTNSFAPKPKPVPALVRNAPMPRRTRTYGAVHSVLGGVNKLLRYGVGDGIPEYPPNTLRNAAARLAGVAPPTDANTAVREDALPAPTPGGINAGPPRAAPIDGDTVRPPSALDANAPLPKGVKQHAAWGVANKPGTNDVIYGGRGRFGEGAFSNYQFNGAGAQRASADAAAGAASGAHPAADAGRQGQRRRREFLAKRHPRGGISSGIQIFAR